MPMSLSSVSWSGIGFKVSLGPGSTGPRFSAGKLTLAVVLLFVGIAAPAQEVMTASNGAEPQAASTRYPDAPSTAATAQSNSFGSELGHGVVQVGKDELTFLKAPFRKKNLKWDLLVVGVTGALVATDETVTNQVNPSWHDRSITISNAMLYSTVASTGAIFLTGLATDNDHAKDTGVAGARAIADSVILYGVMKPIFQRERPFSHNGEGRFFAGNWKSGSFPSGHSMFTWALATVVANEYPKWPVQLLMYSMAATVSTTRVTSGVHFPADVFAGSAMGYLVGRYVAHQDNRWPGDKRPRAHSRLTRVENAVLSHVTIGIQ